MALQFSQIEAVTEKKWIPKMVDNIYDSNPLLKKFKGKIKTKAGGLQIMQPLAYAQVSSSGSYSGADLLNTADNQNFTSAVFDWAQYYTNISISGRDKLMNKGDSAILDFVQAKVENAEKTMADQLGTALFSAGTDPKGLLGNQVFLSTSNTYGGISQSAYSWWQANVVTATTLALSDLRSAVGAATVGDDMPTIGLTTQTVYDIIWGLLQPQQRFMSEKEAEAGFKAISVDGIPYVVDSHCPSGHIHLLNEEYLSFYVHPERNFKLMPFQRPVNQDVEVAQILLMACYISSNNRMHSRVSGITG